MVIFLVLNHSLSFIDSDFHFQLFQTAHRSESMQSDPHSDRSVFHESAKMKLDFHPFLLGLDSYNHFFQSCLIDESCLKPVCDLTLSLSTPKSRN
ncbi:hypothetical protein L596_019497 [Steinernema carpocapsae]|uniref:Uncharacterized protein n=1 Tax=Steinernema carpocapsae TaxID=34508 RepID=A0A4U5MQP4_STECR|nr:hypothetical protein L596_019497 [Steinernema carpocapsae]